MCDILHCVCSCWCVFTYSPGGSTLVSGECDPDPIDLTNYTTAGEGEPEITSWLRHYILFIRVQQNTLKFHKMLLKTAALRQS